jgi:Protein of unknown function (DUF2726)
MTLFIVAVCAVAVVAVIVAFNLYKANRQLHRRIAGLTRPRAAPPFIPPTPAPPPKTAEQERAEFLERQRQAVSRENVTFRRRKVMNRGEYELFRAAMAVSRQPFPTGPYGFWIFPQVSLGQIISADGPELAQADEAYRAINSKRCDLLIADRRGNPVAVLEYQGSGHDIGGTAGRRDEIKRIALGRAGVRFIEIQDGTPATEIQQTIRRLFMPPVDSQNLTKTMT